MVECHLKIDSNRWVCNRSLPQFNRCFQSIVWLSLGAQFSWQLSAKFFASGCIVNISKDQAKVMTHLTID